MKYQLQRNLLSSACFTVGLLLFAVKTTAQCPGNLLLNGSFNSLLGENVAAPGWTSFSTPDVNDANNPVNTTPGYVWTATPIPSADGNTWQNLFDTESLTQTVTNLTPGQSYTLSFEYCAQGITASGLTFEGPVGIKVLFGNNVVFVTPEDASVFTWEQACYTFVANSASLTLTFTTTTYQYAAIDGVCLTPAANSFLDIGNDTTLCGTSSLLLDATTTGASGYVWQDGTSGPVFQVTQPGTYWVEVQIGGCQLSDTIEVDFAVPPNFTFGNDTTVCNGSTLQLAAPNLPGATYLWQDGSTGNGFLVTQPGTYSVEISIGDCQTSDVINVSFEMPPVVALGNDADLCGGEILNLNATTAGADSYTWQDGSSDPVFEVTQTGSYWVVVTAGNCQGSDTVEVNFTEIPLDLGGDEVRCEGETYTLNAAGAGADGYIWQDGTTGASFQVSQAGIYWVTATLGQCEASDTVEVSFIPPPVVSLGSDMVLCEGETLALDASSAGAADFVWQDGSSSPILQVTQSGEYWVTATAGDCISSDTITVEFVPSPAVELGQDTTLCLGEVLTLQPFVANATELLWQDGQTGPVYQVNETGNYSLQVANACGKASDQIRVTMKDCNCHLYLPNVFSPNGDGFNDGFLPYPSCQFTQYRLQLFDRWGGLVFETDDPAKPWEGEQKGKPVNIGTYVYLLEFTFDNGEHGLRAGDVMLVR